MIQGVRRPSPGRPNSPRMQRAEAPVVSVVLLVGVALLIGWGLYSVSRPKPIFIVRIIDGVPRIARGQVTRGFLQDIADALRPSRNPQRGDPRSSRGSANQPDVLSRDPEILPAASPKPVGPYWLVRKVSPSALLDIMGPELQNRSISWSVSLDIKAVFPRPRRPICPPHPHDRYRRAIRCEPRRTNIEPNPAADRRAGVASVPPITGDSSGYNRGGSALGRPYAGGFGV